MIAKFSSSVIIPFPSLFIFKLLYIMGGGAIGSKACVREKQIIYNNKIFVCNQGIASIITDCYAEVKKKTDKINVKLIINRT